MRVNYSRKAMFCQIANFKEVFRTAEGTVFQCNNKNCYWLDFAGQQTAFRVSDFMAFKRQVDQIDLDAMIGDPSPGADCAVIMPTGSTRCFVLDVYGILDLKELLTGAKYLIELNSLIRSAALSCELTPNYLD